MAATAFERVILLQLDKYGPEQARQKHIEIARRGLAQELARQQTQPQVSIEVDGHPASSEEEVRPFGVIVYRFTRMREIVAFAISEAQKISPVLTGRYRNSWFALVDGVEAPVENIKAGATVTITNDQPYARKVHVGARGFEKYAGIVEKVRQIVKARYGNIVDAEIQFITLQGGWVLQKGLRKIHKGRRYGGIRNDAKAGDEITYPSLLLTPKFPGR